MAELRYPNESLEYRLARDELLQRELELVSQVKAVAAARRNLPCGGRLLQDYEFTWATDQRLGQSVQFSQLFREHNTLLLYSFMYGPGWDNPCPSCTSIVDGLDRMAAQVGHDAAIVVIGKAQAVKINAWARRRGWTQIDLVSGFESAYQADYHCQGDTDDRQFPTMHVFKREQGDIYHFWGTELSSNDMDMIWPYWNLLDMTPDGRPDRSNPPQDFVAEYLRDNYLT